MNRTILLGAAAFLSVAFFSCSGGGAKNGTDTTATAGNANAMAPLDSMAQHFPHGGGQPVSTKDITPCLEAYSQIMATYGITADSPSVPITKCPPMTYRTTTTEGLTYITFRHWLDSIVAVIDPNGKGANVWLKIQPGICTQQFVATVGAPAYRTGRISYFIVPALIDSSKALSNDGGGGGFEVGGLQP
ncbi:MAG TPA: hypothetical protein VG605_20490 [Puia sp.]|nr:hypothetical protein [Puia sp.]